VRSIPLLSGCREQMLSCAREHGARIEATYYCHLEAEFGWEGRTLQQEAVYLAERLRAGGALALKTSTSTSTPPLPT